MSVFLFQAEDGIRDRGPSRGLGDVYVRQDLLTANEQPKLHVLLDNKNDVCLNGNRIRLSSGQAVILG